MANRTDDPFASVFEQGAPPVDRPDPFAAVLPLPPPAVVQGPDTRPWYTRADETAGDAIRGFTNAVTFGNMDRIAGGMNYLTGMGGPQKLSDLVTGKRAPQSYDEGVNQQVRLSQQAEERSPAAYLGGSFVGGVALPGFGAEALAAKYGSGLGARILGYGATGAGVGAAQGAGNTYSGNVADYAKNAVMGGVLGGVLGGGLGGAIGARPQVSKAVTPVTDEIGAAKQFFYDKLAANGAIYENPHAATLADQLEAQIRKMGADPSTNAASFRALENMRKSIATPGGGTTPAELETIRSGINNISAHPDHAFDRKTGGIIKDAIDNFYTNPPLGAVRIGTEAHAAEAGDIAKTARKLAQGEFHAKTIDNIQHDANLAASNPAGGPSYENAVWSGVRNIEKADKPGARPKLAGYSDAEKAALERVAYPSWLQTALDKGGTLLGGGKGYGPINPISLAAGGALTGAGAASYFGADPKTFGFLGAVAPIAGFAMRGASGAMARRAIENAYETLHQSNPLYDYRVLTSGTRPGGGFGPATEATRNAVTSAIINRNGPALLPPITVEEGQ